jgi:type II secretory pathway component PulK
MKTRLSYSARSSGSAVIVVLVLLFIMTVLLTANSLALHRFKQNLQSIEHRQLKLYESLPSGGAKS